ncbi:hypothetical protein LRP88_09176 [Fusarium phalaenopsidis]
MDRLVFDPLLTKPDALVLESLAADIRAETTEEKHQGLTKRVANGHSNRESPANGSAWHRDDGTIAKLAALNDPKDPNFEPTVFNGTELSQLKLPHILDQWVLQPYIRVARSIVRVETDVVMVTHLLLYFTTSVPSAALLFCRFWWIHALVHCLVQISYVGTYTLMMHQHIHMRGILSKKFVIFDTLFPYVLDPLMGHSWNSYFYHHVKHHHVEGNGPNDLSSTIRYQRDNIWHFLHYVGRFYFFIWFDLPAYFIRTGKLALAFKAAFWELSYYAALILLYRFNPSATFVVFLLPLLLLRAGLMVGNWGQHAFVDHEEPDSDYRSSITLIDVASNRHCFNDGYHTSHHLNPLRHWREHPVSFLRGKEKYASQHALVFHNIDYIMITVRLMMKDYRALAECMVPIGDQISMTLEDRMALLESHVQRFTEEEIREKFGKETSATGL